MIPAKPDDSDIREEHRLTELVLSWPSVSRGAGRYAGAVFLVFFLCLWTIGWVGAAMQIAGGNKALIVWLAMWTFFGVVLGRLFWLVIQPSKPEILTLGADSFWYDPGTSLPADWKTNNFRWGNQQRLTSFGFLRLLFRRHHPKEIAREELTGVRLERIGDRQRLSFDAGADRKEIGRGLRESDREWLFTVLEQWRGDSARSHEQGAA
ncbi:hypothetical protein [Zavarzinella formosa]|uniref:hypothetical protein n=1 Tax=Zavarzinella formosa TaxID=360055 RepID=UPI00031DCF4D|nr:hypothetical protein [Zavarzinella formosa]